MRYDEHPTYLALLEACYVNSLDDLPFLVLADWLEEYDGEDRERAIKRAAFIRRYRPRPHPTPESASARS